MPSRTPHLTTCAWFDLVYHTLSLLPIRARDASRLHDPAYVAWSEAHLPPDLREQRTLPADAPLLARLLDAAPQAHLLHSFVQLHGDTEPFLATAALPFADVPWPDRPQRALAHAMARALPTELIELFRIALWAEVRGGYLHLREQLPMDQRLQPVQRGLDIAAQCLPGLSQVHWIVCHPLRRAGRLFDDGEAPPTIAIGVPDAELDVPALAPVLQGCHEFALALVNRHLGPPSGANPRTGTPGHDLHVQRETLALCLGARLLDAPELQAPQLAWLSQLTGNNVGARRPYDPSQVRLGGPGVVHAHDSSGVSGASRAHGHLYPRQLPGMVRERLASGAPLPAELRPTYVALAESLEASRRSAT